MKNESLIVIPIMYNWHFYSLFDATAAELIYISMRAFFQLNGTFPN